MLSAIVFLLILSILILIHEFGHFITAKKNGVLVEEFGFGIPPRIWSIKIGETVYSINLLPFGGFVKVLGEEYEELKNKKLSEKLKNRTFVSKKPWQKAMIILAGVFFNFILGWVIISYLFTQGVPVPSNNLRIEKVSPQSPAEKANLKANDIVKSITVKNSKNPKIQNNIKIAKNEDLVKFAKQFGDQKIILNIERNKKNIEVEITPRKNPPQGQGPLGIVISAYEIKKYSLIEAPFFGLIESYNITKTITVEFVKTVFKFVTFQKVGVEVAGPVGIYKITSQAVGISVNAVLQILGLLSLNLAVINILPFPALDGGRLVFIIYEWITKKRINAKIENRLNFIGFAILMSMIVMITISDILKLFH